MASEMKAKGGFVVTADGRTKSYPTEVELPSIALSGRPFKKYVKPLPKRVVAEPKEAIRLWDFSEMRDPKYISIQVLSGYARIAICTDAPVSDTDLRPSGTSEDVICVDLRPHSLFELNSMICAGADDPDILHGRDGDGVPLALISDAIEDRRIYSIWAGNTGYDADINIAIHVVE